MDALTVQILEEQGDEAIKKYLIETAEQYIQPQIHIHHQVLVRHVPGKFPQFLIKRKEEMTGNVVKQFLEDGWALYNGKTKPLVFSALTTKSEEATTSGGGELRNSKEDLKISLSELNDNIEEFVHECGRVGTTREVSSLLLYKRYTIWCQTNRAVPENAESFRNGMMALGFTPINQHGWIGLDFK